MTEPNKEGTFVLYTDRYGAVERKEVEKLVRYYQESLEENKALQSRIAELRNELSEYKEANAVLGRDNQRLYDEAKTLFERIAELEKENAELNASEAGWFNSCTEYQKENDALIIENCALESRLSAANEYLKRNGNDVEF